MIGSEQGGRTQKVVGVRHAMLWERVLAIAALIAAGPVGCAASDDARTQGFVSGRRLRARFDDAGGGARIFRGWFDSQTSEACSFRIAADGTWRCLPMGGLSTMAGWLDASCTQPAVLDLSPHCARSRFALVGVGPVAACDAPMVDVLRVGDERADVASVYVRNAQGECVAWAVPAGARVHDARAEPLATFVRATSRSADRGGGLAMQLIDAEDGARAVTGLHDRGTDAPCVPGLDGDLLRCVPVSAAGLVGRFADASCTARVAWTGGFTRCAPRFAVEPGSVCGGDRSRWYVAGAPVASDALFINGSGTCGPAPRDPFESSYFALGTEVDPGTFPLLRYEVAGSGPVRVRRVVTPDGYTVAADGFEDARTGEICTPLDLSDGSRRCIPSGDPRMGRVNATLDNDYFFDAACNEPVVFAGGTYVGCPSARPALVVQPDPRGENACLGATTRVRVYQVGAERPNAPIYHRDGAGTCELQAGVGIGGAHERGPELGPEAFPLIEARTE
jgi:hypothetical protein